VVSQGCRAGASQRLSPPRGFVQHRGGVSKDDIEAYAWFNVAAALGAPRAIRDGLNLTPEEKARAQQRSMELFNEIEARKKETGK
jgi:hypothetical protein